MRSGIIFSIFVFTSLLSSSSSHSEEPNQSKSFVYEQCSMSSSSCKASKNVQDEKTSPVIDGKQFFPQVSKDELPFSSEKQIRNLVQDRQFRNKKFKTRKKINDVLDVLQLSEAKKSRKEKPSRKHWLDDFDMNLDATDRVQRHARSARQDSRRTEDDVSRSFSYTNTLNRLHSIMKIPELIKAQGYPSEIHKVVTADGYILELHRIPGPRETDRLILPRRRMQNQSPTFGLQALKFVQNILVDFNRQLRRNSRRLKRNAEASSAAERLLQAAGKIMENIRSNDTELELQGLLRLFLSDTFLNFDEVAPDSEKSLHRSERDLDLNELLTPFNLFNPLRSFTNTLVPFTRKPIPSLNEISSFLRHPPSRLVKQTTPSEFEPKPNFFKNRTSSLTFSGRRGRMDPPFFVSSVGDSGASGRPVALLHHGWLSSSANFVLNDAHEALAYVLADAGYDVWLANWRGNVYSRGHVRLDPDHTDYWQFSLDEVIRYDIPAIFAYILEKTQQKDLYYIGHSLGCVMFWGATNFYPYLNDQVRLMVALAPAGFMDNAEGLLKLMALFIAKTYHLFEAAAVHEFLVPNAKRTTVANTFCGPQNPLMFICYALLPLYLGEVRGFHDPYYTDVLISHFPGGTSSVRILAQLGQFIGKGGMQRFDFGEKENMRRYGSFKPPKYSFKTVQAPVAVLYSMGDTVTNFKDVQMCIRALPNVVLQYRVPDPDFTHVDFLFSERAPDLVYRPIRNMLRRF